jgi:hypothetical protein
MSERPYTPSWHIQEALRQYLAGKAPKAAPKKPKAVDDYQFEGMWEAYGKKGNKKTSRAKFNKLDILDQNLIYDHIPIYVLSTPDKQYRKNFETYLNQECWNDEVITNENSQSNTAGRPTKREQALSRVERDAAIIASMGSNPCRSDRAGMALDDQNVRQQVGHPVGADDDGGRESYPELRGVVQRD